MENKADAQSAEQDNIIVALSALSTASRDLNNASDDLNKHVNTLNCAIKALSPGVSAWTTQATGGEGTTVWERSIGYAKVGNSWCIALRETRGIRGENFEEETWPFTEAPRWRRAESVGKIPEMLADLVRNTRDLTHKMIKAAETAHLMSDAITEVTDAKGNK